MDKLQPPDSLPLAGNLSDNWRRWKQRFELYMIASGNQSKPDETKSAILLHIVGQEALEIYNTFAWESAGDNKKVDKIMEKFEAYCNPRKNITWERHVFNTRCQQSGEPIDQYVTDLRSKARPCEFGTLTDSLIRDRIVCGILSDRTRSRLLKTPDLTLQGAIDVCRADEVTSAQMKTLATRDKDSGEKDLDLKVLKRETETPRRVGPNTREKQQCGNCGGGHSPQQKCPAAGITCHNCGRRNHFARVCRSRITKAKPKLRELEYESSSDNDMVIDTLDNPKEDWHVTMKVNDKRVTFKIDQCNVLSTEIFRKLGQQTLKKSRARLVAFGGHRLRPLGKCTILCEYKKKYIPVEFEVLDQVSNVLGLQTITELNLVKRVEVISNDPLAEYAETFTGLGCITGVTHQIKIDPTHKPVVHPPRKVPVTIKLKVKTELERMEQLGVIEKVQEPTEWVNSMVTVIKPNGKLRICIDPRNLNKAIKREHFPMRTIEEIVSGMPDAKIFSVLDASSGFWQVKLDQESAKLCTFNTPYGRYMFTRLPFGISSAQDVFQSVMSRMFEDIDGVEVLVDDLLIWGTTVEEHDIRLKSVL